MRLTRSGLALVALAAVVALAHAEQMRVEVEVADPANNVTGSVAEAKEPDFCVDNLCGGNGECFDGRCFKNSPNASRYVFGPMLSSQDNTPRFSNPDFG